MGQYWLPVNLDKHEYIHPHEMGVGLKLWEQIANHPGVGEALIILCAAMPEERGGGDFDLTQNWHGPERDMNQQKYWASPADFPAGYQELASITIGRWAGDRIALVGDYAEDTDLDLTLHAASIYGRCMDPDEQREYLEEHPGESVEFYNDITWMVRAVIEHELGGHYEAQEWSNTYMKWVDTPREVNNA